MNDKGAPTDSLQASTWRWVEQSMESSGVRIRMLETVDETQTAEALLKRVWGADESSVPLTAATMRALAHSGSYISGAFSALDPQVMVGCTVGFFARPEARNLHSHIAAVDPFHVGRGVGAALKWHQHAWCLDQGVNTITWTYDPAVARNAYFNLMKLKASVEEYLEDFYGPMGDSLNAGSPTDRLLVKWDLRSATLRANRTDTGSILPDQKAHAVALAVGTSGQPSPRHVDASATTVLVEVPTNIERLREENPALAAEWRMAIRASLAPYVASCEWTVNGFLKKGMYIVEKKR